MDDNNMEVRFDIWCKSCKFSEVSENRDPCDECLATYIRESTSKPEKYEEKN